MFTQVRAVKVWWVRGGSNCRYSAFQKDLWPYAPHRARHDHAGIAVTSMGKTTEAC